MGSILPCDIIADAVLTLASLYKVTSFKRSAKLCAVVSPERFITSRYFVISERRQKEHYAPFTRDAKGLAWYGGVAVDNTVYDSKVRRSRADINAASKPRL